jgi:hypothetical protein
MIVVASNFPVVIGETLTFASPSTLPFLSNGEW